MGAFVQSMLMCHSLCGRHKSGYNATRRDDDDDDDIHDDKEGVAPQHNGLITSLSWPWHRD